MAKFPKPIGTRIIVEELPDPDLPQFNIELPPGVDPQSVLTDEQKKAFLNKKFRVKAIGPKQEEVKVGEVIHAHPMAGEPFVYLDTVYRVIEEPEIRAHYTMLVDGGD